MNKSLFILSLLVLVACDDDISVDRNAGSSGDVSLVRPSSYTLAWSDEFNSGSVPDSSKWTFEIGSRLLGGSVWGNNEREYYTDSADNAYLSDGRLIIQAKNEVHPDAPSGYGIVATSARIKTDHQAYYDAIGNKPYGFYEFRARLHCIQGGAWPALWLLGRNGNWPAQGEIDVVEWSGRNHSQTVAASAFHTTATHNGSLGMQNWQTKSLSNMCTDYHLFQLHWTENKIVMGIDGSETLSFTRKSSYNRDQWPFDQPAYIIMNLAVGGNLGGEVVMDDINKMKLEIDYVRVWQKPE